MDFCYQWLLCNDLLELLYKCFYPDAERSFNTPFHIIFMYLKGQGTDNNSDLCIWDVFNPPKDFWNINSSKQIRNNLRS